MKTPGALLLLACLATGTASADPLLARDSAAPRVAALYFEVPLASRDRPHAKPTFGLRLQQMPLAPADSAPRTLLEVPLRIGARDPLQGGDAAMLLGKGAIIGLAVGAVVAVGVLADDGDDDGY